MADGQVLPRRGRRRAAMRTWVGLALATSALLLPSFAIADPTPAPQPHAPVASGTAAQWHIRDVYARSPSSHDAAAGVSHLDPRVFEGPDGSRRPPAKRHYDTHHYYALEIRDSYQHIDPRHVADALGAELVDRVGELKNHWLVRSPKPLVEAEAGDGVRRRGHVVPEREDPVLRRWQQLRLARRDARMPGALLSRREAEVAWAIRGLERQELRRRHKRDKIISPLDTPHLFPQVRAPIAGPEPQPYPTMPGPVQLVPYAALPNRTERMQAKFQYNDPLLHRQWHLANSKNESRDLNISSVWEQGYRGKGVNVCLIDDGLDYKQPDLKDNFYINGSYDFNDHVALPTPKMSDDQHGTRCAGEIAALPNDVCGIGVAHEAHVSGIRILSGPITDVDEAAALNYMYQDNHVYSCSWGPPDDGRSMDAPKGLIAKAMLNGIQNGRDGKGSIYVFAGGNGGGSDDQCNFDGYTNSIFSMTIAAVDREGLHPYYSEMCAAILASSWSSGSGDYIHTTDVAWNGKTRCTSHHGGTSAAAPLVAGLAALALSARPELTWRDMQHIAVHSAVMVSPNDKDWQKTQAGRWYSHKFGYGILDAHAFVEEARRHTLVNPQAWYTTPNVTVPADQTFIRDGGVKSTFTVTADMLDKANLDSLEHVTVRVWIAHQRRGDVDVELISPHGTRSVLARPRRYDDATTGFPGWGFMTLKHWDESPIGEWTMMVYDRSHPDKTGNFYAWEMTLWGACIDPAKASPWNFPEDSVEYHETLPSAPGTTTVHLPPGGGTTAAQRPKPTEHLPGDHGVAPGEDHHDFTNNGTAASGAQTTPEADTGYLAGLKTSSTGLFVAAGTFFICAASLGIFFYLRWRRQRLRSGGAAKGAGGGARGSGSARGGDYQFVPGADEEDVLMSSLDSRGSRAGAGAARGKKGRRGDGGAARSKELYDAFGEVTDSEPDEDEDGPEGSYDDDEAGASRGLMGGARRGGGARGLAYRDDDDAGGDERFTIGAEETTPFTPVTEVGGEDGRGGKRAAAADATDEAGERDDEKRATSEATRLVDVEGATPTPPPAAAVAVAAPLGDKIHRSRGSGGSASGEEEGSGGSWQDVARE